MRIRPVDPRDIRWERDTPVFRVYFWRPSVPGGDPTTVGYQSDEYEIGDADAMLALRWAWSRARERGETFTLYLVCVDDDGRGLVRLAGQDPSVGADDGAAAYPDGDAVC